MDFVSGAGAGETGVSTFSDTEGSGCFSVAGTSFFSSFFKGAFGAAGTSDFCAFVGFFFEAGTFVALTSSFFAGVDAVSVADAFGFLSATGTVAGGIFDGSGGVATSFVVT